MATGTGSHHSSRSSNSNLTSMTDHGSSQPPPNLPPEIITEILSRLPVKPLGRFRCVSKPWRSLLSGTHFIKKHLHKSTTDDTFKNHSLILSCTVRKMCFKSCSVYSLMMNNEPNVVDAVDFKYPLKRRLRSDTIIGVCDGLICICSGLSSLHLWNPSTKEMRDLPKFNFLWRGQRIARNRYCVAYGFGYDHSIDDYKVVSVCYTDGVSFVGTEVMVYTLKAGSWRRIGEFPYGVPRNESNVFVSGALHWQVMYNGTDTASGGGHPYSHWKFVALDLASESFREIPQPIYEGHVCYQNWRVLGGKLSIVCQNRCSHADVWVMKEYGVRESWNKMFRIPYLIDVDAGSIGFPYTPLCYSKNGVLLLEFRGGLLLYNSNDNTFGNPEILNFDSCNDVHVYVKSLVSPNPEDRIERNH